MKFAKGHIHVRVFSYQDHFSGQRRVLVSTYKEFWQRYKNMDSKFRHHYEVIQEGLPCHLYFDLEFSKRVNAENNGDEMVDLLISVIFEALLDKYSIQGNLEWIVELDSSTEEKLSRHLIICIPKTAFKDNSHAGAFVAEILSARKSDERFFVRKDSTSTEPSSELFVDTAAYSRNRCLRLALSSKAGKNSVLLPTGRFKCKDMREEEMFMVSLICNMDADCEKLLVCKMELDCVKTLLFETEENHNIGNYYSAPQEFALSACTSDLTTTYFLGKSPFPALDKFVEFIASIGNVSGIYKLIFENKIPRAGNLWSRASFYTLEFMEANKKNVFASTSMPVKWCPPPSDSTFKLSSQCGYLSTESTHAVGICLLIQNHKGEVMAATCDRIGKASNALWTVAVITRKALLFCQSNYFLDIIACGSSQF